MTFAAIVVLGYLLGSCPWGYWLVRIFRGEDIRKVGQRRHRRDERLPRLRPVARHPGVLLDVLKGFVPAFLGVQLVSPLCGILAGAAAMAGHYRPLFLRFEKGGKMVATGGRRVLRRRRARRRSAPRSSGSSTFGSPATRRSRRSCAALSLPICGVRVRLPDAR